MEGAMREGGAGELCNGNNIDALLFQSTTNLANLPR